MNKTDKIDFQEHKNSILYGIAFFDVLRIAIRTYGAGSKQEISTLRNRTLGRSRRRQLLSLLIQIKRKLKRRRKQKRNG